MPRAKSMRWCLHRHRHTRKFRVQKSRSVSVLFSLKRLIVKVNEVNQDARVTRTNREIGKAHESPIDDEHCYAEYD